MRGDTGEERFQVAFEGTEITERLESNTFLSSVNTKDLEIVTVQMSMVDSVDMESLKVLSIGFNDTHGSGSFCLDDFAFATECVAAQPGINARACPSTSCTNEALIGLGDSVLVVVNDVEGENISGNSNWVYGLYDDQLVYIHSALLECGKSLITPTPTPTLTSQVTPTSSPLLIADFDNGTNINNLGGEMGVFYSTPNVIENSYNNQELSVKYNLKDFGGFWMKLNGTDFSPYSNLEFKVRSDAPVNSLKIELKGATSAGKFTISSIGSDWKSVTIPLASFAGLSELTNMSELVFVLETSTVGKTGTIYFDEVMVK